MSLLPELDIFFLRFELWRSGSDGALFQKAEDAERDELRLRTVGHIRVHSRFSFASIRGLYQRPFAICPLNTYSRASIASFRSVPHW